MRVILSIHTVQRSAGGFASVFFGQTATEAQSKAFDVVRTA